jgi:hypothetical protein
MGIVLRFGEPDKEGRKVTEEGAAEALVMAVAQPQDPVLGCLPAQGTGGLAGTACAASTRCRAHASAAHELGNVCRPASSAQYS